MTKTTGIVITLKIYTDGDFAIKNDDCFFNVRNDYHYSVAIPSENLQKDIEYLFSELKSRVLTSTSRDFFRNFFENLSVKDFFRNTDNLNPWDFVPGSCFEYMSGNQEMVLWIDEEDVYRLDNDQERQEYEKYLELKKKYINKVIDKNV